MINEGFVKSIVSEVKAGLFEGGPGSGNWGHKGRPGMRGGSQGGGKTGGTNQANVSGEKGKHALGVAVMGARISAHKVGKSHISKGSRVNLAGSKTAYGNVVGRVKGGKFKVTWDRGVSTDEPASELYLVRKVGGISAHKITVGGQKVHAREFYNAQGKLDTANYGKLSGANKTQVLKHGIQKYNEAYMPKAHQGKLDANGLSANKKIGALEGMRRAAVTKAKSSTGKESRAAMHVAISLQARANAVFSQIKASGSKAAGSAMGAGSKVVGAGLTAVRTAARPVGR